MMEGAWYNDATAPKYKYLYNGKELHDEFSLNFYDYGARWFDPGMASWWEVDPASEGNRRWSPFAYGNNNPVRFIDPDGRESSAFGGFTSDAEVAEKYEAERTAKSSKKIDSVSRGVLDGNANDPDKRKREAAQYDGSYYYPSLDVMKSMSERGEKVYREAALVETALAIVPYGRVAKFMGLGGGAIRWLAKALGMGGKIVANEMPYVLQQVEGFYVRGNVSVAKGVYSRNIQALASLEEGNSITKLLHAFELEAKSMKATKVVINGLDIVNTKLFNSKIAQRLGYSFEQTSEKTIRLTKAIE